MTYEVLFSWILLSLGKAFGSFSGVEVVGRVGVGNRGKTVGRKVVAE